MRLTFETTASGVLRLTAVNPAGEELFGLSARELIGRQLSELIDVNEFGSTGDRFDSAAMESTWATLKREIRHIHGEWAELTRSQLRTILFDYIETFYNRRRHQAGLDHQTRTAANAASKAA